MSSTLSLRVIDGGQTFSSQTKLLNSSAYEQSTIIGLVYKQIMTIRLSPVIIEWFVSSETSIFRSSKNPGGRSLDFEGKAVLGLWKFAFLPLGRALRMSKCKDTPIILMTKNCIGFSIQTSFYTLSIIQRLILKK